MSKQARECLTDLEFWKEKVVHIGGSLRRFSYVNQIDTIPRWPVGFEERGEGPLNYTRGEADQLACNLRAGVDGSSLLKTDLDWWAGKGEEERKNFCASEASA